MSLSLATCSGHSSDDDGATYAVSYSGNGSTSVSVNHVAKLKK